MARVATKPLSASYSTSRLRTPSSQICSSYPKWHSTPLSAAKTETTSRPERRKGNGIFLQTTLPRVFTSCYDIQTYRHVWDIEGRSSYTFTCTRVTHPFDDACPNDDWWAFLIVSRLHPERHQLIRKDMSLYDQMPLRCTFLLLDLASRVSLSSRAN